MITHDDELIALLLGDRRRSAALGRWLGTLEGRRELAAYRRTLEALEALYGDAAAAPRRTIYYCALPTPIGRVFVAAGEAGLVRLSFRQSEASFVAELRRRLGADVVRSPARTADIVHQLRAYFAGEPLNETDPLLSSIDDLKRRGTMIAHQQGEGFWRIDIRLQRGSNEEPETIFLDI